MTRFTLVLALVLLGPSCHGEAHRPAGEASAGAKQGADPLDPPYPSDPPGLPSTPTALAPPGVDWPEVSDPPEGSAVPAALAGARLLAITRDGAHLATVVAEPGHWPWWVAVLDATTLVRRAATPLCLGGRHDARRAAPCMAETYPSVRALAFSPDGAALAILCVGCAPGGGASVHAVSTEAGRLLWAQPLAFEPWTAAWGADGVIAAGFGGLVVLDGTTGAARASHASDEAFVAIAPDGSAALTGATRTVVPLRGASTKTSVPVSAQTQARLLDGGRVVAFDSGMAVYDAAGKEQGSVFEYGHVDALAVTPDGAHAVVAVSRESPSLRLFDGREPALLAETLLDEAPQALAVGPAGEVFAAWETRGVVRIAFDPVTEALALSQDETRVASLRRGPIGTTTGLTLVVTDATSSSEIFTAGLGAPPRGPLAVAFSPEGTRVAVALPTREGTDLRLLAQTGEERRAALPFAVRWLAWGPAGIAAAGERTVALVAPGGAPDGTPGVAADGSPDAAGALAVGRTLQATGTVEALAPDAAAFVDRTAGRSWEDSPAPGTFRMHADPDRLDLRLLDGGAPRPLAAETRGQAVLVGDGVWLLAEGGQVTVHGTTTRRVAAAGAPLAASRDGRWLVTLDGSYGLAVHDLVAGHVALREPLHRQPTSVVVSRTGRVWIALPVGGVRVRAPQK
ncbi:MAG: cell division protein ZapC [Myxococcales bacterium]